MQYSLRNKYTKQILYGFSVGMSQLLGDNKLIGYNAICKYMKQIVTTTNSFGTGGLEFYTQPVYKLHCAGNPRLNNGFLPVHWGTRICGHLSTDSTNLPSRRKFQWGQLRCQTSYYNTVLNYETKFVE